MYMNRYKRLNWTCSCCCPSLFALTLWKIKTTSSWYQCFIMCFFLYSYQSYVL